MPKNRVGAHLNDSDVLRLVAFIDQFLSDHARPPTRREMQKALGLSSVSVAQYWLGGAEARGWVMMGPGILSVTREGRRALLTEGDQNQIARDRVEYFTERLGEAEAALEALE